jgi:nitric oxide reductase subunit C
MKPIYVFVILCISFLVFSSGIYFSKGDIQQKELSKEVADGKMVWQKYNCQSCHQIFGLGGYLGPDLTNLMAQEGKGKLFLKAMVESGTKQMPAFKLSEAEMQALSTFLSEVNLSGKSDPRSFEIFSSGMIKPKAYEGN